MTIRALLPRGGTLPDDVWRWRHRGVLVLLWFHVPALFVFALTRGYEWQHALTEAGVVALPAVAAHLARRSRRLSTVVASVGLMIASAVLVHLSGGMIEAHFHFFVMVGVVVLYQDWRPFLIAITFVVLHHGALGALLPHDVYNHQGAWNDPWTWAGIHGFAILAMSAAGIANWTLNERSQSQLSRLAAIVESSDDAIYGWSLDGTINSWNDGAVAMFGYSASEIIGRPFTVLMAPKDLAEADRLLTRVRRGERVEPFDTERLRKDGTIVEVSVNLSGVRGPAGDIIGGATTARDIGGRKRLEVDLAEALDRAVESSRLKSEFLATMSHEIRTPMNGVIGLTGLLMDTELTPTQRDYASGVRASGEALLAIINDILDFSKIEAGKLELEVVDFDLHQAIGEVVALVGESARSKGLMLTTDCPPAVPTNLRGDVGRFRQILLNLVANAVKFTEVGHVTLRVARAGESEGADRSVRLRIEVEDTGVGIAEHDRARLFEPFSQADASTTRRYGGTGLGLAICALLASEMGGSIGVESTLGTGSLFWVELPFTVGSHSAVAREPSSPYVAYAGQGNDGDGPRACLLIVEDNVINQLVAREMVRHLGYRCEVAANGAEALEALQLRDYAAVLMDCYMPEMDGFEATVELRRREGGARHTPIIAMTAGAMAEDRERCEAAGMDDYVSKPVDVKQLESALRRWIGSPETVDA